MKRHLLNCLGNRADFVQGNGISARDIKAVVEAGYNTVESVAYTLVHFFPEPIYTKMLKMSSIDPRGSFSRSKVFQKQRQTNLSPKVHFQPRINIR